MTDTLVPETTAPIDQNDLKIWIAAVVRLKDQHLSHVPGTRALVVSTREGRYSLEVMVPGFPIKFWVAPSAVEVMTAPVQEWWKLLGDDTDA